ncbi:MULTISPECIES: HlyD family efflux transporter periplasmic adaptor subunit [Sphingomonas]|uniref:HlyD family efflux transporter periplasmic adaptor subunit n=2 Tax=Sphingomonadaceae TaxID=41297 RepID=UPI0009DF1DE9|nr:HlyD family efflux transporter periplasmic adaptor subunit [Sphingomonas sp. CFBP 8764]MBD8641352.1 HlyD family efflux transporter periplasmic adaptor subunit [Sphingomonas sp. CFBP 13733]RZM37329.1 MAG: HlyD family efflux transporter periplasmic adaptor subunit [Sphingomonas sp.]
MMDTPSHDSDQTPAEEPKADPKDSPKVDTANPGKRKRLLLIFAAVLVVIAVLYFVYDALVLSKRVTTDNAYVAAETAQVMPLVSGQVIAVTVSNTQTVKRGQVLMRLDDADLQIAVAQAEADLAGAERRYGQTAATGDALQAQANARGADIGAARAQLLLAQGNLDRAQIDYQRRQALVAAGAVSGDEVTAATNALRTARANVAIAQAGIAQATATRASALEDRAANTALTRGTTRDNAPEVLAARAKLRQARLDLSRAVVRAPIDGVISQRNVQIGQRLAPGTAAMVIVPVDQLYVDANYKEGQLQHVRVGQHATLISDLHGDDVVYHGRVVGLAGGTGASSALIPAQNATGNWIKVVQRLPVRIALDPKELRDHPLRVGLSMDAEIDISGDR